MDENRNVMIGESLHEAGEGVLCAFNQDGQLFSDKLSAKAALFFFPRLRNCSARIFLSVSLTLPDSMDATVPGLSE